MKRGISCREPWFEAVIILTSILFIFLILYIMIILLINFYQNLSTIHLDDSNQLV